MKKFALAILLMAAVVIGQQTYDEYDRQDVLGAVSPAAALTTISVALILSGIAVAINANDDRQKMKVKYEDLATTSNRTRTALKASCSVVNKIAALTIPTTVSTGITGTIMTATAAPATFVDQMRTVVNNMVTQFKSEDTDCKIIT